MPALGPVRGVKAGALAHEFALKDLEGREYRLKDLVGKKVVQVVFWATWCFPCIEEVPMLLEAHAKYHDRGLEVLGIVVNINQTREKVTAFVEDFEITYPILWDEEGVTADLYRVSSIPQNFLIGKDGIIRYAGTSLPGNYDVVVEKLLDEQGTTKASRR